MSMRHDIHTGQLRGNRGMYASLDRSVDPQLNDLILHALKALEAGQQESVAGCRKDNLSIGKPATRSHW